MWESGQGSEVIYMVNMTHEDEVLREIFQDVRFRRALSLGIDREEINEVVYFGHAEPRQYTVLDTSIHYVPEFAQAYTEYDPDRANALLDEMGLDERDSDGFRLRPDGERVPPGWERTKWPLWGQWCHTGGEEGEEPPELVKQIRDWWEEMMVEPDAGVRKELSHKILEAQAENLWVIDTVGRAPYPIIVNRDIRNFPPDGLWVWDSQWTLTRNPEQIFFDR